MFQLLFKFLIYHQVLTSQPKLKLKKTSDQNGEDDAVLEFLISTIDNYK